MLASPFTFYRGAAKIMAADLDGTPTAGLQVQLCGDAHLSNFGAFASPERRLLFDLNDFDETLPGPFEYDVKRLAASFTIAARNNGFGKADTRAATLASVAAYREAMASFAAMGTLDIWYAHLAEDEFLKAIESAADEASKASKKAAKAAKRVAKTARKGAAKARTRDSLQALSKLGERVDGQYRIVSQPPIVVPARELEATYGLSADQIERVIREQFRGYRATLQDDRRQPAGAVPDGRHGPQGGGGGQRRHPGLHRPAPGPRPAATRCSCRSRRRPGRSWRAICRKSRYKQPGERVVQGQRMMQAASDIFLGWTKGADDTRHYYWRQLRDMKASAEVESMAPVALAFYARACGWTLARAHARSGDPIAIAAYLGEGDQFDRSIADFAQRYADQNELDYQAFADAIRSGRLEALEGQ